MSEHGIETITNYYCFFDIETVIDIDMPGLHFRPYSVSYLILNYDEYNEIKKDKTEEVLNAFNVVTNLFKHSDPAYESKLRKAVIEFYHEIRFRSCILLKKVLIELGYFVICIEPIVFF